MENEPLSSVARELLEMSKIDQEMRTKAQRSVDEWNDSIDSRNTARLKEIIAEMGWPTISKVGPEASQAAWLLVQHAYAEPGFMKQCLELSRRYSNHQDMLPRLADLLRRVHAGDQTDEPGLGMDIHPPAVEPWRVQDRLSAGDITTLLNLFRAGTPKHKLAVKFSISLSSVKRILRQHGIRGD